jgi:hypothetical protein
MALSVSVSPSSISVTEGQSATVEAVAIGGGFASPAFSPLALTTGGNGEWNDGVFGNGVFVVVADTTPTSPSNISYSADGDVWTPSDASGTAQFYAAGFGGGIFFASGVGGALWKSTNGSNWSSATSGTGSRLQGICTDNAGKWLTVPYGSSASVKSINNGTSWTVNTMNVSANWADCCWNQTVGKWFAVHMGTTNNVSHSPDMVTWTPTTSGSSNCFAIESVREYVLTASSDISNIINWTANGATWYNKNTGISGKVRNMHYCSTSGILSIGMNSTPYAIWCDASSGDPSTWVFNNATVTMPQGSIFDTVMCNGSKLILGASAGTSTPLYIANITAMYSYKWFTGTTELSTANPYTFAPTVSRNIFCRVSDGVSAADSSQIQIHVRKNPPYLGRGVCF